MTGSRPAFPRETSGHSLGGAIDRTVNLLILIAAKRGQEDAGQTAPVVRERAGDPQAARVDQDSSHFERQGERLDRIDSVGFVQFSLPQSSEFKAARPVPAPAPRALEADIEVSLRSPRDDQASLHNHVFQGAMNWHPQLAVSGIRESSDSPDRCTRTDGLAPAARTPEAPPPIRLG
jgi:hypothetical protein